MTPELAIDIFKEVITFSVAIVAPFLGVILFIGLIASIVQSVTSIQEQTLTFAPKLLVFSGVLVLLAPWLLRSLTDFTQAIFTRMPSLAG